MMEYWEVRALEISPGVIIPILYLSINSCDYIVANSVFDFSFLQALVQMDNMYHIDIEGITVILWVKVLYNICSMEDSSKIV